MESDQNWGMSEQNNNNPPARKKNIIRVLIISLVLILAVCAGLFYFISTNESGLMNKDFSSLNESEVKQLTTEISNKAGKLMILPSETPQIIKIGDDIDGLKASGSFWSNVQVGDYVLVFINESRIIVYSPERNIIVNAGPIINDTSDIASSLMGETTDITDTPATTE